MIALEAGLRPEVDGVERRGVISEVICVVAGDGPRGAVVPGCVPLVGENTGRTKEAADDGEEVFELHGDGWQQILEKEPRPRV